MDDASPFDPDAAAQPGSGVFGLPEDQDQARVWLMPVPFDATASYRDGAAGGPAEIRRASVQVDLYDVQTGRPYRHGIFMIDESPAIVAANGRARQLAEPILVRGGATESDAAAVAEIDAAGALVNTEVEAFVRQAVAEQRIPGVVGGDHSVPFAAMQVLGEEHAGELGVLHVDAHMDLRPAYEGFAWSHASIMHNVLARVPGVARLVQVGIRDVGEQEVVAGREDPRVMTHFDLAWQRRRASGEGLLALCREAVEALPRNVYVSFDIDGLDPALCPGTGTPVPGGLTFDEACLLLETVVESGRQIVGFDLCEVASHSDDEWDGNVGARMLYKLCGFALLGS